MNRQASYDGFTQDERAAMKARAAELKKSARSGSATKKAEADATDCLDKIAEMSDPDRAIAQRLHAIVMQSAGNLAPKTWYGMPAYARDGKVVLFFKAAEKFKVRYAEVGFSEEARLDEADVWPTAYAVTAMSASVERLLTSLVTRACH